MKRLIALLALSSSVAFGATLNPVQLLNPTGSTAGQTIVSTGASTAPGWASVPLTGLSSQAANTVVANFTGSAAAPVAFAMPSCSGSANALQYTSGTGITCGTNYALLSSPAFNGTPTAPTASAATNNTQIATTAFANAVVTGGGNPGSFTTLAASGAFTPSQTAGIVGTTTNNNANAGSVGEYAAANTAGNSITNNTAANCTSVSLTAGDWDVSGTISFTGASNTSVAALEASISSTSATLSGLGGTNAYLLPFTASSTTIISTPVVRQSLSATTTIYLVSQQAFTGGTMTCSGFIRARRVR